MSKTFKKLSCAPTKKKNEKKYLLYIKKFKKNETIMEHKKSKK